MSDENQPTVATAEQYEALVKEIKVKIQTDAGYGPGAGAETPLLTVLDMVLEAVLVFVRQGKDPAPEIRRILSADPELAHMHANWEAKLLSRFG